MSNDLRDHARRLLDVRVVLAFIAGFLAYQILMTLWQLILPIVFVVGGVWLLMRYLFPERQSK